MIKSFKTLKRDIMENRWRILIGLFALIIVDVLQLFIPRIIKYAIDDLTSGVISPHQLLLYGIEVLILSIGIGGFRYVWRYLLLGAARRVEKALRDRLFLHLQTLSFSYFSRTKVGDLMAHATNDIEAVRMSLALGSVFLVDTIILGILTIFFMIYIHPLLTLYAILPMPLITVITLLFSRVIHQRFEILQRTFALLTERVRESIAGIRVVKAYVQEEAEREKLSRLSQDYIQKNIGVTKVWGIFFPFILFFSNLSMAIVLYLGGKLTIFQSISIGDFVAFMSYLGMLAWPMMALGWAINVIQRGEASMGRLNKIFGEIPEISDLTEATWSGALKGRIEMRGLTFSPGNGGNPLLRDIHLTVHKGERIVIVGRIGAGKTVLCDLLVRILEPPKGRIFFDGIEIHHIPLKVLRRNIGYVPQETLLFSDTIRENIAFGNLDATEEEIEKAARTTQIYEEVMGFPEGMNTVIGEKGITLSGGQRQRIAIARTLLMNPPIFILDDALSSVDIQTEERILEGLEKFLKGKTSILITHRIAPLQRADRIIVLDEGRVVEMGDHPTLLAKGGIYADLYWQRQLEEELEQE
ncbi:MAG: ABC transporter ATP-binding protein/permease [Desulfobacterales bacterium]|nr:ABC transporter ATP-binding protein/permease [Desulfobacterales bacterium]